MAKCAREVMLSGGVQNQPAKACPAWLSCTISVGTTPLDGSWLASWYASYRPVMSSSTGVDGLGGTSPLPMPLPATLGLNAPWGALALTKVGGHVRLRGSFCQPLEYTISCVSLSATTT